MANSIVQTIREAEIDARSLSEFVYNPADAMVSRRLAPSIHTLNYYLRFFDGAVSSATADAKEIEKQLLAAQQQALGTVSYIENTIRSAIDTTVIENSPVSDALVSVDGSLSQRTINKGLESIADLSTIKNPKDGLRVYVKSYHAGLGLGGGYFTYDSSKTSTNDYGYVINGWVRDSNNNEISVIDFGSVGDGVTSDKQAVQAAIDYCHGLYLSTGATVNLYYKSGSTYVLDRVKIKIGVNHICLGGGAVLLKTPAKPEETEEQLTWRNIFTIEGVSFSNSNLDDRVVIEGIVFDGNSNNMNWTVGSFNQQQGGCLKLYHANIPEGKRFKIKLKDVTFRNSVADGVTIARNIDIIGTNIEAYDCFRGGIVHTGGNTIAVFDSVVGESANVHIEIDSAGTNGKFDLHATYSNVEIDRLLKNDARWGGFYATPSDGSVITLNNFKCYSKGFYIQGGKGDTENPDSTLNINDSYFVTTSSTGRSPVYFPPNITCSNTHFHHVDGGTGLHWYWTTTSGSTKNRKAIFKNGCKFTSDGGVEGELPNAAIYNHYGYTDLNNYFEFYDTTFEGFRFGIDSYSGCQCILGDGCIFNTTTVVKVGSAADRNVDIKFGKISLGKQCNSLIYGNLPTGSNSIEFNGTTIVQEKLTQDYTGTYTNVNGLLTLLANSKPDPTRKAWSNTIWRVVNAGLGQPYEYKNYSDTPGRGANWRAVSWLTASGDTASRPKLGVYDVGTQYINTQTNSVETWTGKAWMSTTTPSV